MSFGMLSLVRLASNYWSFEIS